nr:uncharacterized protein LOC128696160 [Cherax quadricarinatus]
MVMMVTVWCTPTGVRMSAAAVTAAALTSLPSTHKVTLELTDVSDDIVSHACDLVQELQPPGGYWWLRCENSPLTMVGIQDMTLSPASSQCKVKNIEIYSEVTFTLPQEDQLVTLAKTTLNCDLTKKSIRFRIMT